MDGDLIVAVFPSRKILTKALDRIMEISELDVIHAAIVARAKDGEIIVLGDNISADEGGIAGGTFGAAITALGLVQIGALALPGVGAIIALGAGALVGGLVGNMTGRFAANLIDSGYRREHIEQLTERLEAGRPALVLEVADAKSALSLLRAELQHYRAELVEPLA